jgi:hypothetical protein
LELFSDSLFKHKKMSEVYSDTHQRLEHVGTKDTNIVGRGPHVDVRTNPVQGGEEA